MTTNQINNLDKLQREFSERLIRIEVKQDSMMASVNEMKDGMSTRLSGLEQRVDKVEDDHKAIGGVGSAWAEVQAYMDWQDSFRKTWKLFVALIGTIGTVAGFILSSVATTLGIIR